MTDEHGYKVHLTSEDYDRLRKLRGEKPARVAPKHPLTRGASIADWVAKTVGSWHFIIIQSIILGIWIILNGLALIRHWDPYPFILLNLVLSFQAAYAAPIIMMSQNRQAAKDRLEDRIDYETNAHAAREIAGVQDKLDLLLDILVSDKQIRERVLELADRSKLN